LQRTLFDTFMSRTTSFVALTQPGLLCELHILAFVAI